MKKNFFFFFALISNTFGSEPHQNRPDECCLLTQIGYGFSLNQPVQYTHSTSSLMISPESVCVQSSGVVDRIDPLIHRLVDMLSQTSFPADFQENNLLAVTQEIDSIIGNSVFDTLFSSRFPDQQGVQSELQGFLRECLEVTTSVSRRISSAIEETPQNLFAVCIHQCWFEVAKWIFKHDLESQGFSYCEIAIQEANRLMQKYKDVYVWANTKHYQQVRDDLYRVVSLVFLLGDMIRVYQKVPFDALICEVSKNLGQVQHQLVTTEQPLSLMSSFQLLISRVETELNEADLDPIKTDIDQRLPKIRMLLDLIHRGVNSVTLSKGEKALSLIDLCIEKRFFSTIQWLVGKGVPLRADQITNMFDVAVKYLKEPNAYLCEQEDLFSLLRLILQTAQQNIINENDKEALKQLKEQAVSKIIELQNLIQSLPNLSDLRLSLEVCWPKLSSLVESKLQNCWDPTVQWAVLSLVEYNEGVVYELFQERRATLAESVVSLYRQKYDLVNEMVRLLSMNPSDEVLLENIHNVEDWLNQEELRIEERNKTIASTLPEELQPHQRYAEIFRIVSSGECSKEEFERCERILTLLTPDEINDIKLWRGIPLVIRIASLVCEGNWAYGLFSTIFSKSGIDISSLIEGPVDGPTEGANENVIVSQKHIHDEEVAKQIKEYYNRNKNIKRVAVPA